MLRPLISKTKLVTSTINKFYLPSLYCSNKAVDNKPPTEDLASIHRRFHTPNNFERKMLVWTGRYKTDEEVPSSVTVDAVERARSKFRIKVANYMIIVTLIACVFVSMAGKRAAERGESVTKMNLDWHKEMNQKSNK